MKYVLVSVVVVLLGVTALYGVEVRQSGTKLSELESQLAADAEKTAELDAASRQAQADLRSRLAGAQRQVSDLEAALKEAQSRSSDQSQRIAALEKLVDASRARPFRHGALFYDPEHVVKVRASANAEPWRTALLDLKAKADGSLRLRPEPIRQPWSVPSPFSEPEVQESLVKPLEDSSRSMLALAQYYFFSGDERYASKAVEIAGAWTGSLMELENMQAVYQAGWEMLVMAMAAEMLGAYPGWKADDRKAFGTWLNERAWHMTGREVSHNNHLYWVAAFAAAAGVLSDDPGLFRWSAAVYRDAISYGMAPDGHIPAETDRGALGMFYQNFAIEPLVLIAEIARRQQTDLWGFSYQGKDLKLAIDYLFRYLDKPEDWPWSRRPQQLTFLDPREDDRIGWFEIAYYRYRDPGFAEYLAKLRPIWDRRAGGMTTLTHGLALQ